MKLRVKKFRVLAGSDIARRLSPPSRHDRGLPRSLQYIGYADLTQMDDQSLIYITKSTRISGFVPTKSIGRARKYIIESFENKKRELYVERTTR